MPQKLTHTLLRKQLQASLINPQKPDPKMIPVLDINNPTYWMCRARELILEAGGVASEISLEAEITNQVLPKLHLAITLLNLACGSFALVLKDEQQVKYESGTGKKSK